MASVMSDSASSDVPDGRELELLVEITTEVDSHLPAAESQWIDLLMNAYDSKVRLLPTSTSTSKLFHWVRKIAQIRQPGQRIWDCFKTICEESDIELGFEPSMPEIQASPPAHRLPSQSAPPPANEHLTVPRARVSDLLEDIEFQLDPTIKSTRVSPESSNRASNILQDLDPIAPRINPYQSQPNNRASNSAQAQSLETYNNHEDIASLHALSTVPRRRVTSGSKSVESVELPTMPGDRFYPLTLADFETLRSFSPEEIEEVAVARRHLVRHKAFVAWRNFARMSQESATAVGTLEDGEQEDAQQGRRLIAESRSIALQHAQNFRKPSKEKPLIRPKPQRSRLWSELQHLENITEEATLEAEEIARHNLDAQIDKLGSETQAPAMRWSPKPQPSRITEAHHLISAPLVREDLRAGSAPEPDAAQLLQQARNMKVELYYEAWRQKTHEKAKLEQNQLQASHEMKVNLYVQLWRDRVRGKTAKEQALMQQVKEMKAGLVFEEWNKHTRLYAVVEDNDKMYAEQYMVKWHDRSERKKELQRLADDHKYEWACELVWAVVSRQKDRRDHLNGLVDLVRYYRNAIEPFNKWRTRAKTRQNERLAGAYRDARRVYKTMTVSKHLSSWHNRVIERQSLLEHARAEVRTIRAQSGIQMMIRHAQQIERLHSLLPIAQEQAVLLHVEHCCDKWRDRARQWRAMKRVAEEMQQVSREKLALEAFRRWRTRTAIVLETQQQKSQDQEMIDPELVTEIDEPVPDPQTPQPANRWKSRLSEPAPSTPQTAPAHASRSAHRFNQTPKTAPGPSRFAAAAANLRAAAPNAESRPSVSKPVGPGTVRAPRTVLAKRTLLDPAAAPFRTPRRVRGLQFTDPVFFQKLKQVMPDHALLNERPGGSAS